VGHGHGHGHGCTADHHRGEYTERQRADLDLVLAFNHRLAQAVADCLDITDTVAALDPDPLRYMWVDEGDGQIPTQLARAAAVLDAAPQLIGQTRGGVRVVEGSGNAARPSVATRAGETLVGWLEWQPERGDRLLAELSTAAQRRVTTVVEGPEDLFRPTAVITADGTPWLLFGRSVAGRVGVWACRFDGTAWSAPEPVSDTDGPSFNQEACAHPDGSLHVCWQGRVGDRFGIFARRWHAGSWADTDWVSEGAAGNVWDPTLAATQDGMAYAWAEYAAGSYAVVLRGPAAGPARRLTGGTDYALHPSLAATADGRLWCAFDVITVHGHGGSGPTRLRPRPEYGRLAEEQDGMREPGASVPPELLPEVSAGIRVVCVDGDGLVQPPGELAPGLNVTPSALPRLQATPDGGLAVGYRVHRQLPLMTYYWEAAVQVLGPAGWQAPITFSGTDATLEELSLAADDGGVVLATQSDGRLERALHWTEGFGGRECPYLADHHGAVIWHGVHGAGQVVLGAVASTGPAASGGERAVLLGSDGRQEARRWAGGQRRAEPYRVRAGADTFQLYWGDLHRHSLVSRCTSGDEPSLEDFYRYAWDVNEYDFWAVTDHAENSTAYQWWSIQKIADLLHVPGRFVPLYGFEWTSADCGHQNVVYGDVARGAPIFSAFAEGSTTPDGLWRGLAEHPEFPAITIPHHPGSAMVHNDWDYHDPRYSRLVEVFQACRGNYESPACFRQYSDGTATGKFMIDGLLRGHRFGLIASSDHGHGASYVAVLASSLSRQDIFDGLYARRTCASTTRDVLVDLRLGAHLMGSQVQWEGPRPLRVHAQGYAELARVELLRDGAVVHTVRGEPLLAAGELRVDLRVEWGRADKSTRWDGRLTVSGGRLLVPEFVGPEVVAVDPVEIAWAHTTHSFGEPYGAQRGGVEVSVCGPADAMVHVECAGRSLRVGLGELADRLDRGTWIPDGEGEPGSDLPGELVLQPAVGALLGLGARELDLAFDDDDDGLSTPAFYYARVVQVDGEMAWSSPIWVDPP
jgi:PAS domain-containing protein